jgi:hypothetical protein
MMTTMDNTADLFRDRIKELRMAPIDDIVEFSDGNPVDRTEQDIALLDASLKANGYAMPVEVREREDGKLECLDGHGRVDRIRVLWPEVKELRVIVLDVATAAEGRRLLLGFRNSAKWDLADLDKWVERAFERNELGADEVMELSGLTAADLESLAKAGEDILNDLPEGPPPADATDPTPDPELAASTPRPLSSAERAAQVFVFPKERIAAAAFDHYRGAGFPFPNPSAAECMISINRLASMSMEQLIRTHEGGACADKFQPHRYSAVADAMISPFASFSDDKRLHYVVDMIIDSTGAIADGTLRSMLGMVQGAQSCSNFRPGFAAYLYRRFCKPGGTVLDTSAGYGGRLVGALASTVVGKYIGIDPNVPSIEGSKRLLRLLGREEFATFLCEPAEDVDPKELRGSCAFAFTSPPYFNKEVYSDDPRQSGNRYPEIDAWRENFLVPMLKLTHIALEPGAHAAINIADVLVGGIRHPLGEWTVLAAKIVGFEHVGTLDFPIGGSRNFGGMKASAAKEDSVEPVFLFRKDPNAPKEEPAPAIKRSGRDFPPAQPKKTKR